MPISTKLLSALESRMKDFVESRGAKVALPIAMTTGGANGLEYEIQRIITQRLVWIDVLATEHQSDAHRMEGCHLCQQFFYNLRNRYEGMVREFLIMNRDLLAEIELSH
jgi:hypothetical protein